MKINKVKIVTFGMTEETIKGLESLVNKKMGENKSFVLRKLIIQELERRKQRRGLQQISS